VNRNARAFLPSSRINPERNMCQAFLDLQPDLFGGFTVVKELGRIGSRVRRTEEPQVTEVLAVATTFRLAGC